MSLGHVEHRTQRASPPNGSGPRRDVAILRRVLPTEIAERLIRDMAPRRVRGGEDPFPTRPVPVEVYFHLEELSLGVRLHEHDDRWRLAFMVQQLVLWDAAFVIDRGAQRQAHLSGRRTIHATVRGMIDPVTFTDAARCREDIVDMLSAPETMGIRYNVMDPEHWREFHTIPGHRAVRSAPMVAMIGNRIYAPDPV